MIIPLGGSMSESIMNPEIAKEQLKEVVEQYNNLQTEFQEIVPDGMIDDPEKEAIVATIRHKEEKLKRLIFDFSTITEDFSEVTKLLEEKAESEIEAMTEIGMPAYLEPIFENATGYDLTNTKIPTELENFLSQLTEKHSLERF